MKRKINYALLIQTRAIQLKPVTYIPWKRHNYFVGGPYSEALASGFFSMEENKRQSSL